MADDPRPQLLKSKDLARELEYGDDEEAFDKRLRKLAMRLAADPPRKSG